ncbi:Mariner Mos1 transposase [Araneus ventricosus]|uniref:Mariner Mos1 transposase n=1 Tax=Araneus ventricosus TaxID=182803 RepID=A0A4Y2SYM6_ARAVE|nr:Mariner Mos1 transposase [Araneus ventricosus]
MTGNRYRLQLMRLSRSLKDKRLIYEKRRYKVILQHGIVRPHVSKPVNTYFETLKWEVLLHPPYSPDFASSDYHLLRSMTHGLDEQHFRSYEDAKKWSTL